MGFLLKESQNGGSIRIRLNMSVCSQLVHCGFSPFVTKTFLYFLSSPAIPIFYVVISTTYQIVFVWIQTA